MLWQRNVEVRKKAEVKECNLVKPIWYGKESKRTDRVKSYVSAQLDSMSRTNPMISFTKPLITRILDKNFGKITKALDLIADENGNVDIEGILSEMMDNLMTTQPFTIKTSFIGDVEIGGGNIKLNIPLTDKRLVFNMSDLENFKEMLITKDWKYGWAYVNGIPEEQRYRQEYEWAGIYE